MSRPVDATTISDQVIRDTREVTARGHIIATWPIATGTVVAICIPHGQTVDIHPA